MGRVILLFSMTFFLIGCGLSLNSSESEKKFNKLVAFVKENYELEKVVFSHFDKNFRSWLSGYRSEKPLWNVEIIIYDRYKFNIQTELNLNQTREKVKDFISPTFLISEINSIQSEQNESLRIKYGKSFKLNSDKWKELIESNFDFEKIGIILKKNQPVSNISLLRVQMSK